MKIAILYICTGKYNIFFHDFYESCEQFLLKGIADIEYFVFTDDMSLSNSSNVHKIQKECQGFPADSLFRFEIFLKIKESLRQFDYIYFFNSNAKFISPVGREILPDGIYTLVGAEWPVKRKPFNHPAFYPYEKNKRSLAYISSHEQGKYVYYMGGINGGTSSAYLEMIETLSFNIRQDYNSGIVAKVHDESHINRYFRDHPCKILTWEYCLPEEFTKGEKKAKIIFRNKVKLDPYFNKGRKNSFFTKLTNNLMKIVDFFKWYI